MGDVLSRDKSYPADAHDLDTQIQLRLAMARLSVPVLYHQSNPNEYLYIALFDGTGQDVNNPDQIPTNVGVLSKQAEKTWARPKPPHRNPLR